MVSPPPDRTQHPPAQVSADIGRVRGVTREKPILTYLVGHHEVDDGQIRVGSLADLALGGVNPKPSRGVGGEQLGNARQRERVARILCRGQHQRQGGLPARDATPRGEKILLVLDLGRRRRVVARDQIHAPARHRPPQRGLLGAGAQRRRALGERPEALDVGLRQDEIMRAGLAGDVEPLRLGVGDEFDPPGRADVDNVQRALRFPGEEDRALDRLEFRDSRT